VCCTVNLNVRLCCEYSAAGTHPLVGGGCWPVDLPNQKIEPCFLNWLSEAWNMKLYIYIYIYMCVCVCVYVCI
jgi:hypothetical protein